MTEERKPFNKLAIADVQKAAEAEAEKVTRPVLEKLEEIVRCLEEFEANVPWLKNQTIGQGRHVVGRRRAVGQARRIEKLADGTGGPDLDQLVASLTTEQRIDLAMKLSHANGRALNGAGQH